MNLEIPIEKIDLTEHYVGLDIPAIEQSVRNVAKEFIQGVLQENMHLEIHADDENGELHVVLWANLSKDGVEDVVAYIPIQNLFDEYIKRKK